jgi:poly(hydroxyalkanoate) depolymerase family esterase
MDGQPAGRFNASSITETIKRALDSAGLDTRSGPMKRVTDTIEQALSAAGLMSRRGAPHSRGTTIDSTAREVDTRTIAPAAIERPVVRDETAVEPTSERPSPRPGEFLACSFANAAGARAYKVYVPAGYSVTSPEPMPMVVMLHGCTQSPDDFAAGTRMNALADEHGFVVVYPEQCTKANMQKCWNWFRAEDQGRESGEPAIIAGITRTVASTYRIDVRRIFVAGMSSGAAMAVILGATFPDLYAAVGAHSGLAYGAAHDLPSAVAAMHGAGGPSRSAPHAAIAVPTIVFHGDGDRTVNARNATKIVEQAIARPDHDTLQANAKTSTAAGGRKYSRIDYMDASNQIVAEQWTLHGAGHAWSGGSAAGSFTDVRGPDASKEMIRFFLSLPRAGTA